MNICPVRVIQRVGTLIPLMLIPSIEGALRHLAHGVWPDGADVVAVHSKADILARRNISC